MPQLGQSLAGDYAFRQTQTAFGIRGFAEHGVHLTQSPLPVFGTATDVPMEFPLFQAFGRILMHLSMDASTAGRVAGLVGFQSAAVLWWVILRRWRHNSLATMTLVMFEILPFGLHWGAASLIDYFSVALGLVMVLGFDVSLRSEGARRRYGWAACALGAWSVFLVKITTVPSMGILLLVSAVLAVMDLGPRAVTRRAVGGLVVGPGLGLFLLALWTYHADRVKGRWAATDFLTSGNLTEWNFGGSRLDPHEWQDIVIRTPATTGVLGLTVVLGVALGVVATDRRTRTLTVGLLLAALAPVLIFFNLYVVHAYYQISLYPFLVALGALGVVRLGEILVGRSVLLLVVPLAVVVGWAATAALSASGRHDLDQFRHESPVPVQVAELEAVTPAGSRIIAVGCDWNPQVFYFANRSGLMLRQASLAKMPAIWRQNTVRHFRYLVTCDQGVDPADLLPAGTRLRPSGQPDVFRVKPPKASD